MGQAGPKNKGPSPTLRRSGSQRHLSHLLAQTGEEPVLPYLARCEAMGEAGPAEQSEVGGEGPLEKLLQRTGRAVAQHSFGVGGEAVVVIVQDQARQHLHGGF
jgi:hypothetical protein